MEDIDNLIEKKERLLREIYDVSDIMLNALKASNGEIFANQLPERGSLIEELNMMNGCTSPSIVLLTELLIVQIGELEKEAGAYVERIKGELSEIKKLQRIEGEAVKIREIYNQITQEDMSVMFNKSR